MYFHFNNTVAEYKMRQIYQVIGTKVLLVSQPRHFNNPSDTLPSKTRKFFEIAHSGTLAYGTYIYMYAITKIKIKSSLFKEVSLNDICESFHQGQINYMFLIKYIFKYLPLYIY